MFFIDWRDSSVDNVLAWKAQKPRFNFQNKVEGENNPGKLSSGHLSLSLSLLSYSSLLVTFYLPSLSELAWAILPQVRGATTYPRNPGF